MYFLNPLAPQLRKLTLKALGSSVSDVSLRFLADKLVSLRDLDITSTRHISPETVVMIASHSQELNKINVSGCTQLREEEMGRVVAVCPSLKTIEGMQYPACVEFFNANPTLLHLHVPMGRVCSKFCLQ